MKKIISLLLAFLLCLSLTPPARADDSPFADVKPDFWAYDSIKEAYYDFVMAGTGYDEGGTPIFSPSGKLNAAQFATVLTRAFYSSDIQNSSLPATWPIRNIEAANKHNLFNGIAYWTESTEVTREMMAQMMYNVMADKGVILPNENEMQSTLNKIPDISDVDSNYRTAAAVCYCLDLLSGVDSVGTFAPKGVLNRAQTAVIYTRLKAILGGAAPSVPSTPEAPAPTTEATLTNGMPVTEENVLALIEEYRNGKEPGEKAREAGFTSYKQRSEYDAYNPKYRIVLPSGPINGTECAKFAFAFFDDIFGADVSIREISNPADVRPGDLIHFAGHWCVATGVVQYYDEDNYYEVPSVDGGPTGLIAWGSGSNIGDAIAFYTRYPE